MRDIREDLRERLKAARSQFRDLEEDVKLLETLLAREERRWKIRPSPTGRRARRRLATKARPSPIAAFLREVMSDGQLWSLTQLKQEAQERNMDFHGKSPGHVLHFALVALKNAGQTTMPESGVWQLSTRGGNAG